jgi:hypothetical protein
MNVFIESMLVGIYSILIYLIFENFISNNYILLLVCGFIKHFLGYYLNIWTWYCNNGNACFESLIKGKYISSSKNLLVESVLEGLLYLLVGSLFIKTTNKIILFFGLGFSLHMIFEWLGIHHKFCKDKCNKRD